LDVVRKSLRSSGATDLTTQFVAKGLRDRSNTSYSTMWNNWVKWVKTRKDKNGKKYKPCNPPSIEVANFLAFLRHTKGWAPSYVKQHRSAINTTIKQMGYSIPRSSCIPSVIKGIDNEAATMRRNRSVPQWDIFLVLSFLRKPEFRLQNISLQWLTLKTVFLAALASARRPCEVHALSGAADSISYEANGSITLNFIPGFVMKTQKPSDQTVATTIRPLTDLLGPDDDDRHLCPVKFLKAYISRVKRFRSPNQKRLFISFNPGYEKDVTRATLSRWISTTVVEAYKSKEMPLCKPRAHEVRAISTSLAAKHAVTLEQIMNAAYWRRVNTFISYYLRDTCRLREDGSHGVASIVAAGEPLHG
jgi:hypothetical protein